MTETVGIPGDRICSFIEGIEHIEEEIKALNEGKKEVLSEAKGEGFDVKVLKEILRLRKLDKDARDEHESLLDLYLRAMESAGAPQAKAGMPRPPPACVGRSADAIARRRRVPPPARLDKSAHPSADPSSIASNQVWSRRANRRRVGLDPERPRDDGQRHQRSRAAGRLFGWSLHTRRLFDGDHTSTNG